MGTRVAPAAACSAALLAALAGCAPTLNYTSPAGPRYEGRHARPDTDPSFKVVTFNVKWGRRVDRVAELFRDAPALRDADFVCLQEMDERGVDHLARLLGYDYVYYPAVRHPVAAQNFGNAVLSRWPIVEDRKIVLPERHRFRGMMRIAVGATLGTGEAAIRAYCVHLETAAGIEGPQRRRQVQALLADARSYERVVVAGDLNNRNQVGPLFEKAGYTWLTKDVGRTMALWSWDHIFTRGLAASGPGRVGTVREVRGASDHRPVWAEIPLAGPPAAGSVP